MLDDIDFCDRAYVRHMERASRTLAECLAKARAGLPTDAPKGLAGIVRTDPPCRAWSEAEILALREMRSRGRTAGQIALAMKRSIGSVKDGIRRHASGSGS